MRRHCRLVCLALALVLLTPALCGCNIVAPKPTPEPATIYFGVQDVIGEAWDPLIERFQVEYPHITVEVVPPSHSDLDVVLAPSFYLGMFRSETGGFPGMPRGLTPLDAYAEADPDFELTDLHEDAVNVLKQDGQLWGIPAHLDMMMVYYNKDVFDMFGAPYPEPGWTWDDFLMTAGRVTSAGAGQFGYAPIDEMMDPLAMIYAHGGWIMDDINEPTRMTFNAPEVIDAMDWYANLFYVYNVAPTPDQARAADLSTVTGSIYQNKIAMWMAGFTEQGGSRSTEANFPAPWKFRWGMVPLPADKRSSSLGQVNAYYMLDTADSPDACWQWIAWMTEQVPGKALPVRDDLLESDAFEDQVGEDIAEMARAAMQDAEIVSLDLRRFGNAFGAFFQASQSIQRGRKTPQEALDRAQELVDASR